GQGVSSSRGVAAPAQKHGSGLRVRLNRRLRAFVQKYSSGEVSRDRRGDRSSGCALNTGAETMSHRYLRHDGVRYLPYGDAMGPSPGVTPGQKIESAAARFIELGG